MKGRDHLSAGPSILSAQNILLLKEEDRGGNQQTDGVGIRFTHGPPSVDSQLSQLEQLRPLPPSALCLLSLFLLVCSTKKRIQGQEGGLSL